MVKVRLLVSAQVMISQFVGLSPMWGSALTAWSLLGIFSLPLSLTLPHLSACACSLSLSLSKQINFKKKSNQVYLCFLEIESLSSPPASGMLGTEQDGGLAFVLQPQTDLWPLLARPGPGWVGAGGLEWGVLPPPGISLRSQ